MRFMEESLLPKTGYVKFLLNSLAAFSVLCICAVLPAAGQDKIGEKKKGQASFYAKKFNGRRTANGERFHNRQLTAAHRSLPFGTLLRVTNRSNSKSVVVRVNDRGPYSRNRLIDVSHKAAREIGMVGSGVAPVEIEVLGMGDAIGTDTLDTRMLAKVSEPLKAKGFGPQNMASKTAFRSFPVASASGASAYKTGKVYDFQGVEARRRGFGVQVGTFQVLDNAIKACRNLVDKQVSHTYIMVEKVKEARTFSVLAGTFKNRKAAEAYVASLQQIGYAGFVKKYEN